MKTKITLCTIFLLINIALQAETRPSFQVPDLIVQSYTIRPENPKVHESIYFDIVVKNIGTGPAYFAAGSRRLQVLRSDGSFISYAGYSSPTTILQPNETFTETIYFMPYTLDPGESSFIFRADPSNLIEESDESNNDKIGNISLPANVEYPDLIITNVEIIPPEPVFPEEVHLNVTIKNQGSLNAVISYPYRILEGGIYTYYVYPSQFTPFSLAPGEEKDFDVRTTAQGSEPGTHTITLKVDPGNKATESDESNNTFMTEITIKEPDTSPGQVPDLIVQSYTIRPENPKVHESIYFDIVVKNIGTGPAYFAAGSRRLQVLRSDGSFISYAGYSSPTTILQPNETFTETIYFMPYTLDPGESSFIFRADPSNLIEESDESNNDKIGNISLPANVEYPDLIITNVEIIPPEPVFPEEVHLNVTIKNQGSLNAVISYPYRILEGGIYTYYVYPSQFTPFSLAPGEEKDFDVRTTAQGSEPGTHTITLKVDPGNKATESDESNNTFITEITIKEPDTSPSTYIPDPNFEQALIDLGIDSDGTINQRILRTDAELVTKLDVSDPENNTNLPNVTAKIADLTGIEAFINLTELKLSKNQVAGLDVSQNTLLIKLVCDNNQLASLDITNNTAIDLLWCQHNQINSLDVLSNTQLKYLICHNNEIPALDLSNNPLLYSLACGTNFIQSIDVSENPALQYLAVNNLQLTDIDVSNNLLLKTFVCYNSQLTSLDLSQNTKLFELHCQTNQLTSLDLTNNPELVGLYGQDNLLTFLDLRNGNNAILSSLDVTNNDLTCINVDDETADHSNWQADPGVIFSNNCGYNTQPGVGVKVALLDKITGEKTAEVTFDDVEASGETTIEVTKEVVSIGSINLNEEKTVYNIETTADYEGDIDIIIDYAKEDIVNEDGIRLFHKKGETWEDVTTSVDQENDEVHGTTSSLSPFIIVEDVVDPTIVCISDVTQDTDEGLCAAVVNGIAPIELNDNIGVAGVTYEISGATIGSGLDDASGTTFNYGMSTVTYTVSDVAGNTSTCSFDVTVTSNLPNHVYVIEASTPDPIQAGTDFSLYADCNANNLTSGIWYFSNDGEINHPSDAEFSFIGDISGGIVSGTFNFAAVDAGVYAVKLVVVDACGQTAEAIYNYVVIFDPTGGFVTGGGWIHSPEGALVGTTHIGKANFGLVAKYKNGNNDMNEVDGNTNFQFKEGDFHFKSSSYDDMSLVISGERKATYRGSGSVNGTGYYDFLVTVVDGEAPGAGQGDIDTFRIKIWTSGAPSDVIYDNELGTAENSDANTGLGGGSIVIHKPKGNSAKISDSKFESIGEELISELNVVYWPNPTDAYFNLELKSNNSIDKVNIYVFDLNNRLVHVDEFDVKQQYQFGNRLQSGIYFVKLLQANSSKTIRVIKY